MQIFEEPIPDHATMLLDGQGWHKVDGEVTWQQNERLKKLQLRPYPQARGVIKGPFRFNCGWKYIGCSAPLNLGQILEDLGVILFLRSYMILSMS